MPNWSFRSRKAFASAASGSAITDLLVEQLGSAVPPVKRLGLPDEFPHNYGLQDDLFDVYGLTSNRIAASVYKAVKKKDKVA